MNFASRVVRWQRVHGRRDLPWQGTRDAYRIWLSEIMLQQTQVSTVIPYFERFLARFPDVGALARAKEDDVLALWSGLGYYARARNLHRAAREVVDRFEGVFPRHFDDLVTLPGIGRSTAGAIAAFASGERRPILDGNVRRVLARHAGIAGDPASAGVLAKLWDEAESRLPRSGLDAYTQGMMDLGAGVCTVRRPACDACPVHVDCVARLTDRVGELPGKRIRAAPRRRHVAMLVVVSRGEVLLEKRPASGIWGGLWSLPEIEPGADAGKAARAWGVTVARVTPLEPFEHAFTHFTLEVSPLRVDVRKAVPIAAERGATWLPLSDLQGAALPSPVRKLLRSIAVA
jgi:A/G-specific adenine glycosylase